MPKDKVAKLSISMPTSFVVHIESRIEVDNMKGVSDFFQKLVADDIRRTRRKAKRQMGHSKALQDGIQDLLEGRVSNLDPSLIERLLQHASARLQATQDDQNDTSVRGIKKESV